MGLLSTTVIEGSDFRHLGLGCFKLSRNSGLIVRQSLRKVLCWVDMTAFGFTVSGVAFLLTGPKP